MWVLYARSPTPDVPHWQGRRLLALLDALLWPGLIAALVVDATVDTGVVGPVVMAMCALFAVRRCARALWHNERYRFTTWRLGVPLVALMAVGAVLKLAA